MRQRAAALGIGVFLAVVAIGAAELVCYAFERRGAARYGGETPYLFAFSETLGYKPIPNANARAWRTYESELLYDVVYRTDEFGRRVTPDNSPVADRFLVFFGCSFTFGEGVSEAEALPAQTAAHLPGYTAYNYGFSGYGPQQLLARLEAGELRYEVAEASGTLVYVFISDHIRRAIGSTRVVNTWGRHFPYYTLNDDVTLERRGSFLTGRPELSRFYGLLKRDRILPVLGVDLPLRVGESDRALTAKILSESRRRFEADFPGSEFVILLYPEVPEAEFAPVRIRSEFEAQGLRVIDLSSALDMTDPRYRISHDGHPTALAHARVAEILADALRGPHSGGDD